LENRFLGHLHTLPTIEDVYEKDFKTKETIVKILISELTFGNFIITNKDEEYNFPFPSSVMDVEMLILIYSISDTKSFESMEAYKRKYLNFKNLEDISMILVGNKSDLKERQIEFQQGNDLAKKFQIPFLEVTAKEEDSIQGLFEFIVNSNNQSKKKPIPSQKNCKLM
jgi:Ras homolog enriched in brain